MTGLLMLGIGVSSGSASATTCGINFDDYAGIKGVYQSAKTTFAIKTSKSSNTTTCPDSITSFPDSRMLHPNCRIYEQACGSGGTSIFAWDQSPNQHYHLMYEDESYSGVDTGCDFGLHKVNGVCVPPADYASVPRYFASMANDAWLEIGRTSYSNFTLAPFNMYSIDVKDIPIQIWMKKTDGSVWGWSNLPRGNWALGSAGTNIVAAWVAGAPGTSGIYQLWDFAVTVP